MTDYIKREDAINAIDVDNVHRGIIDALHSLIREIPAADVRENVHGEWQAKPLDRFRKFEIKCSACGWSGIENYDSYVDISEFEYCPHCGAQMDECGDAE